MADDDVKVHTVGRFYLCSNGHKFDDVPASNPNVSPFPPTKPCPTCSVTAPVQFDTRTHTTAEKCPFGQCAYPPNSPWH